MTTFCIAFYKSHLSTVSTLASSRVFFKSMILAFKNIFVMMLKDEEGKTEIIFCTCSDRTGRVVLSNSCCLPGSSWAGPGGHSPNPTRRGHIQHPARCFGPLRQVHTVSTNKKYYLFFLDFIIYILSFFKKRIKTV